METQKIININDSILAMLTRNGKVIAQVQNMGFSSVSEIILALKVIAESKPGLTQLFIRNFSQGWHIDKPMFLSSAITKSSNSKPQISKYGQYALNF